MNSISKLLPFNKNLEKILENYFQAPYIEASNNAIFINAMDKTSKVVKAFGKFEKRSIKDPNNPLIYEPGMKFFHKGKNFYQDKNNYSYARRCASVIKFSISFKSTDTEVDRS